MNLNHFLQLQIDRVSRTPWAFHGHPVGRVSDGGAYSPAHEGAIGFRKGDQTAPGTRRHAKQFRQASLPMSQYES